MTAVAQARRPNSLWAQAAERLESLRLGDTVPYLTLFLAVIFPFTWWPFVLASRVALLTVLLLPSAARSPVLWGILALAATATIVNQWDLEDNHKYLLCYWLWVMCISHIPNDREFQERIVRFNARFFLIFIFLGAALQKFWSPTYMSGAMFELQLLLDSRFLAFAHLVGIDPDLARESLKRLMLLQNPYIQVVDNYVKLQVSDHLHLVAKLVTWYDLYVQFAIGLLLLFCRRITDIAAHILLLFFILTTYIPAPVLGFGLLLVVMGYALARDRFQVISAAYLLSIVAVLVYQVPWREWVLGT